MSTSKPAWQLRPQYLPGRFGRLFTLYFASHRPYQDDSVVLFIPPFAEEMNKSRAVMTEQARQFAAMGIDSVLFDFHGTGDSAGDFSQATWQGWQADLQEVCLWLRAQGKHVIHCVAVRSGALLLETLANTQEVSHSRVCLWQCVTNGAHYWKQFMRLRIAADSLRGDAATSPADILRRDGCVEIAGYTVSSQLADAMATANLNSSCVARFEEVLWIEMLLPPSATASPASQRTVSNWRDGGVHVVLQDVTGEHFWVTPELARVPELHKATTRFFAAGGAQL